MYGLVAVKEITVSVHDQAVDLRFPGSIASDLDDLFPRSVLTSASAQSTVTIREHPEGFTIDSSSGQSSTIVTRNELPLRFVEEATRALITRLDTAVALHAAAAGYTGTSILMPGLTGSGKTSLAAWLIENGFEYLTDELAILTTEGTILGFPRPLVIKPDAAQGAQSFSIFQGTRRRKCGSHLLALPPDAKINSGLRSVALILFPRHESRADVTIEALTPGEAALKLVACNLNARNLENGGFDTIATLCRQTPAIAFRYSEFDQLKGTLDAIIRCTVENRFTPAEMSRFLAAVADRKKAPSTATTTTGLSQTDTRSNIVRHPIRRPAEKRANDTSNADDVEELSPNLIGYIIDEEWPDIRPAPLERGWMDATQHRFAYRCLPLNIANCHGWEILCPSGFMATWNGACDSDCISVEPDVGTIAPATSHFGHGVLTFQVPCVFRTNPGVDLIAQGPINRPKDAIAALTGVIETDWCPFTFTMNWLFTRPRAPVRFEKGEPFCHIFPLGRGELDTIVPVLRPISENPELKETYDAWLSSRLRFNADQTQPGSPSYGGQWQKFYQHGLDANNVPIAGEGHRTKVRLRPFTRE
jgi:hypothetical protein